GPKLGRERLHHGAARDSVHGAGHARPDVLGLLPGIRVLLFGTDALRRLRRMAAQPAVRRDAPTDAIHLVGVRDLVCRGHGHHVAILFYGAGRVHGRHHDRVDRWSV